MKSQRSRTPPRIILDESFLLDGPRLDDAAAHRRFALDRDAARFLGWTIDQARSAPESHYLGVVDRFLLGWETGARYSLAIRRITDGEAVGMVELHPRPMDDEADVSYLVAAQLRRQGLASQAVAALLDWASRELDLRRAIIECDVENVASQRVAEKCGFDFVGRSGDRLRFKRDLRSAP